MTVKISDLMDSVEDGSIELTTELVSAERIRELTMKRIAAEKTKNKRRPSRRMLLAALAAVLVLTLGATACATGLFGWKARRLEEGDTMTVHMHKRRDEQGNVVWEEEKATELTELVLIDESSGTRYEAEFRMNWLPETPELWLPEAGSAFRIDSVGENAEDGWYRYYSYDLRTGEEAPEKYAEAGIFGIPYQIEVISSYPVRRLLFGGRISDYSEEDWDGVKVLKIEATGRNGQYQFRYVILLNETEGWAVSVGGEDGMETLEKIARNLEIRVTDKAVDFSTTEVDAGYFMIGRG